MDPDCRASILIPTAFNEYDNIYHALEQYTLQKDHDGQPLDPKIFEINLFVNGKPDKQSDIDKTIAKINEFKKNYPDYKVNVISETFENPEIQKICKTLTDAALLRSLKRPAESKPLYFIRNDADTIEIDEAYIATVIENFEKHPEIQVATGRDEYNIKHIPYMFAARRLWQIAENVSTNPQYFDRRSDGSEPDSESTRFVRYTIGRNSFFRASTYAQVDGFDPNGWPEDIVLTRTIARKFGRDAVGYIPRGARMVTDARRDINAANKGKPLIEGYHGFSNDESLRVGASLLHDVEHLEINDPEFMERLDADASATFYKIYRDYYFDEFNRLPEVVALRRSGADLNHPRIKELSNVCWNGAMGNDARHKTEKMFEKVMFLWGVFAKDRSGKYQRGYELRYDANLRPVIKIKSADTLKANLTKYKNEAERT